MLRQYHTYNIRWGSSITQHVIYENAQNWILPNNKNSQLIQTRHDFIFLQCCCCWTRKSSCVIQHLLPSNHQWLVTQQCTTHTPAAWHLPVQVKFVTAYIDSLPAWRLCCGYRSAFGPPVPVTIWPTCQWCAGTDSDHVPHPPVSFSVTLPNPHPSQSHLTSAKATSLGSMPLPRLLLHKTTAIHTG